MQGSLLGLFVFLALATAAPASSASPVPAPSAAPAAIVHIKDFAYHPPTIHIHVGESVEFINDDGDAHTVTAVDKTFDSGGLDTHETWTKTFTNVGSYEYFCALHPYMKAVVVVTASGGS
jgi:plastocyanin